MLFLAAVGAWFEDTRFDPMKAWLVAAALLFVAPEAQSGCRLALALALDVSGSVDDAEYHLQMNGLATALADAEVRAALLAAPGAPVAIAVYEWSSSGYQRLVQDWVLIEDQARLTALVSHLRGWQREPAPEATGIGAAMVYGQALIARSPGCWRGILDVSGDGKNNDWPVLHELKATRRLAGLEVNALVVTNPQGRAVLPPDTGELVSYFRNYVIQGPNAFVEVAQGFEDYARAMQRKLLKELRSRPLGLLR
ncbi:MAG: DUF1194 domain-containing protein [Pseudomonadota bacterium]